MAGMMQTGEAAANSRLLLAYMQHMARTARCDSARRLFEMFTRHEKRWLEVKDGLPFPVA